MSTGRLLFERWQLTQSGSSLPTPTPPPRVEPVSSIITPNARSREASEHSGSTSPLMAERLYESRGEGNGRLFAARREAMRRVWFIGFPDPPHGSLPIADLKIP